MVLSKSDLLKAKHSTAVYAIILFCLLFTLLQDYLRSNIKNTAYFFSESIVFSSFWMLFIPFLYIQYLVLKSREKNTIVAFLGVYVISILLHLLFFPCLVWILSYLFLDNTFAFFQTLKYTLSEHVIWLLLFYALPIFIFQFNNKTIINKNLESRNESIYDHSNTFFIVNEGLNKTRIESIDILYFSANPPYVNLYTDSKKYLQNDTLKSIFLKLDPDHFVKIHKSSIVNINKVTSYSSRLNGDYDLTLENQVQLRISRNFASEFKRLFNRLG